jgi:Amt family ammonium transporter
MESELTQSITNNLFTVNNLWMMIATALVFIMHLGFASLEAGLTRSKNTVNILFKNSIIPGIGIITYTLVGFNLMYPGEDFAGAIFGFAGFGVGTDAAGLTSEYNVGYTYWTDFLFQAMFAATAATIVSGAVAERIKLGSFLVFSTMFVGLIFGTLAVGIWGDKAGLYPIAYCGMWKWGAGWLDAMDIPFYDFAGSTLVHSVGGWGALTGVIFLGPRIGKYIKGKTSPIPGHSMPRL